MLRPGTDAGTPGTDRKPLPGFLSTTFQLCAGTGILTRIYKSSPGRALWRFFLLTVLCSILAAIITSMAWSRKYDWIGKELDDEIGGLVVTHRKISFEKSPDVPRRLKLPCIGQKPLMLEYFPEGTFQREDFNVDRATDIGLVIFPGGLATWTKIDWDGEDYFSANFLSADSLYSKNMQDGSDASNWGIFSGPALADALRNRLGSPVSDPDDAGKTGSSAVLVTGSQGIQFALSMLTAVTLLMTLFRNLATIGLIILLVSLIQYLRASTLPKGIAYRNVLTIMVYSTFPAQIAATLLDAAGIDALFPFLSFNLLFVCIFFVYQIFAFRAVMKKVCPQNDRKDDDFSDSDF